MKLKRRKGRKQCKINCSPDCGPGRQVAIATVHEVGGVPVLYPIRVCQHGAGVPRSKGLPICRDCAELWHNRWFFDSLDLEDWQYKLEALNES